MNVLSLNKIQNISFTKGSIPKSILLFAIPIFIGNLFQQLYNVADSIIVGNYIGREALAAVSSSTSLIQLLIGFFDGLSIGASVVIARYFGAKDIDGMKKAIHTTVALGVVMGLVLTIIGVIFSKKILILMDTPKEVLPNSIIYFRVYFMGSFFLVMYNILVSVFRSVGDSIHPLFFLIIGAIINIILDYLFVAVLGLGIYSAAMATVIAQSISFVLCLIHLLRVKKEYKIEPRLIKIDFTLLKQILQNGVPAGIQGCIISLANVVVQSNVNHFGESAIAGFGAYDRLFGFATLPITCFSLAMSTFVSQNLGARKYNRVRKGAKFAIITCVIMSQVIGVLMSIFSYKLISLFTDDITVISYGVTKANICAIFIFLLAFSHVISGILRGAGKSYVPMFVMMFFWCIVRLSYVSIFVKIFPDVATVAWAYPITWSMSSIYFLIYFLRIKWEDIKVLKS